MPIPLCGRRETPAVPSRSIATSRRGSWPTPAPGAPSTASRAPSTAARSPAPSWTSWRRCYGASTIAGLVAASRATGGATAAKAECARSTVAEALKSAGVGGRADLAEPHRPDPGARARPVRPLGEPLARHPDQQRLRVPRPAAASGRRPSFLVRKSDGNTSSRCFYCFTGTSEEPGQPLGDCTAATWSRYRRKIALAQGKRAGSRHLIRVRSGSVAGNCHAGEVIE
jgi:hypothetical protein